jgi:hypothetical protein
MMENHRSEFIVIMAGYPKEMDELLSTNPGLMYVIVFCVKFREN